MELLYKTHFLPMMNRSQVHSMVSIFRLNNIASLNYFLVNYQFSLHSNKPFKPIYQNPGESKRSYGSENRIVTGA